MKLNVSCDTPLGIEFATLEAKGSGVIVTERLVEKFAEARGWKPDECELVLVVDADDGRILWTIEHDGAGTADSQTNPASRATEREDAQARKGAGS